MDKDNTAKDNFTTIIELAKDIDNRLDHMYDRMEEIETKVDSIDDRMEEYEKKLDRIIAILKNK